MQKQSYYGCKHRYKEIFKNVGLDVHPSVFIGSVLLSTIFVVFSIIFLEDSQQIFANIKKVMIDDFGWMLILSTQFFLLFVLFVAISRFGHIRLGGKEAKPEYNMFAWFSMLFAAGMGIGLLFWGIGEPMYHFVSNPYTKGQTVDAAVEAMNITFLHWGFHGWGIYALVGLSMAYFTFNRGLPLTIRSAFYPFVGDSVHSVFGSAIDILAIMAILFGVATSLGFGADQIASGIQFVFDFNISQFVIVAVVTALATVSVILGLEKGVRRFSEINVYLALILMIFVVVMGPSKFIFASFVQNTGHYLSNLLELSSWTQSYKSESSWIGNWTIFYWSWWISWSPFVGLFIAQISKGRTIREFIIGVILAPSLLTFLWITVFGGSSLYMQLFEGVDIAKTVKENLTTGLFVFFEQFPMSTWVSLIAIIVIAIFFITSADSAAIVIDTIVAGGKEHLKKPQKVFWSVACGVIAAVLMVCGGLSAFQTAVVITGLPFALILVVMAFGLYKSLSKDFPADLILPDKFTPDKETTAFLKKS